MLTIRNLSKSYGLKRVVDEVTVEIPNQKVTSFIGPNGAGKSTVFNMIARLIEKESGEIVFYDEMLENWKSQALAKKLAILKQNNNLTLKLTVEELVAFGRFPHSKGNLNQEDKDIIIQAIAYMELEEFKDKYLDELSGGQRQRAYIAMVIAQDTEYILFDEPLNNLDVKHSIKMMQIIQKLCYELHKTVIVVMHDINFASCYSDYIVAFKNGKVVKAGATDEVIDGDILEEIYEIPFEIQTINDRKICIYF